jgi:hypothetical protein
MEALSLLIGIQQVKAAAGANVINMPLTPVLECHAFLKQRFNVSPKFFEGTP